MKKWVLAAAAAVGLAGTAQGAVITLQGVATNGPGDFTWTYQGTLGPDEGLRAGDQLIVYDFAGYIDGSIFDPSDFVTSSVEFVSSAPIAVPGSIDDPNLVNLVFTYTGPDFRNEGGPFAPFDFNGLGARSTYGNIAESNFYTLTTKNNPDNVPAGSNTPVYSVGLVSAPAVPEPATWAMMVGGFGLLGAATRRRSRLVSVTA